MIKKMLLSYSLILGIFAILIVFKQNSITKKNQKAAVSFYSSLKKEGKPVLVQKIKKDDFESFWKITAIQQVDNSFIGYVPKAIYQFLKIGTLALIDEGGKKVVGEISKISSDLNFDSGMYAVIITFQEKLNDKKYVVELSTTGIKNVIMIPNEALHRENDQFFVWIIKDNKAHKHLVTVGERNNKGIMVQGLEEHDQIVLHGSLAIEENDLVKINDGN